jgi:hypothetical protein
VKTLFVKVAQSGSDLRALMQFGGAGGAEVIIKNVSIPIIRNFNYRQGTVVRVDASQWNDVFVGQDRPNGPQLVLKHLFTRMW